MSGVPSRGPRQLGGFSATVIVMASMIGAGVFTTSGFLLEDLQSRELVLAAWVAGGLIAAMGAACYGALARRIPESGGEYVFLSRTLHPAAGWMAGWLSVVVGFSAPLAMAAHAFGEYTATWWPSWAPRLTGTFLLMAFAAIHAWHVRRGAAVQNVILILKLLALLFFVVAGLTRLTGLEIPAPPPAPFRIGAFAVSLVWISFSYAGYNAAIYLGGEIVNPEKNLPRSMIAGTLAVVVIYTLLNAVFVFAAPVEQLAGEIEVGRLAARALGGEAWAEAVTVLVCAALVTSVSSMTMIGPRVGARMAQDGYLPRWLAGGEETPRNAILFQLVLALIILWTLTFESLLTYIGFTLGLSTAAAVAGLMRLRRREGTALPVPGWPWLPSLFLVCVLSITVLTIAERPGASALGLGTLAMGWMLWRWKANRGNQ